MKFRNFSTSAAWVFSLLLIIGSYVQASSTPQLRKILEQSGVSGGLVVHVGCGNGALTSGLRVNDRLRIHGLDTDAGLVEQTRKTIQEMGLYGPVSVHTFDGTHLPYINNLVNLVVVSDSKIPLSSQEIMRVLAPGGRAYFNGKMITKPRPDAIDEWTHYLHGADNNAVANDSQVGPPRHMQWLSNPLWARHHDKLASISSVVTAKGRLFYIIDEGPVYEPDFPARWSVTAIDAFNGLFLWKQSITSWTSHLKGFRSGPVQLQRLLVTDGDYVYAPLGLDKPVSVLDAATGKVLKTLKGTEDVEEILFHEGVLVMQVGIGGAEHALLERSNAKKVNYKDTKAVMAVSVASGKTLWRYPSEKTAEIMPQSLTVSDDRVFFQEKGAVVCLDVKTGQTHWQKQVFLATAKSTVKKDKKAREARSMGWTFDTLVVQDGVVLISNNNELKALAAESGDALWDCAATTPFGKTPSVDILVVNGVVWVSPEFSEGRDLKTGNVVSSNNLNEELITLGHHHRCYRNKATSRYIIQGYRGLEFRDTQGDNHVRNNWIRGICQYGIMPANGLSYIPPHNCACYTEAKLFGFWALSAKRPNPVDLAGRVPAERLHAGPAYGKAGKGEPRAEAANDWPTYRHDVARSGVSPVGVSDQIKVKWTAMPQGKISAPVIGGDTLLVARSATHQVLAFDTASGQEKWTFSAGAPVDSPPTIHGDLVLFGSSDGYVYCLRLTDGELIWRFLAAPADLRTVALQEVESLWPVHGSILVKNGTAYFTAGRSTYLDGGLYLYGLDPLTGKVKYRKRYASEPAVELKNIDGIAIEKPAGQQVVDFKTKQSPDKSDSFTMAGGNISDVLVADDTHIYLRHEKFDQQLNKQDDWSYHLFSTSRLIDDHEAHRSHLYYGRGDFSEIPIPYEWLTRTGKLVQSPFGKLLAFDGKMLWGTTNNKKNYSYNLFRFDISTIEKEVAKDHSKEKNGTKSVISMIKDLKIHPRALIKAGDQILIAGFHVDKSLALQYGKAIPGEGVLLRISAADGTIVSRQSLPASPVFDGMAVAHGKLYLSLENGTVVGLGK